jgi:hypothetical protein
LHRSSEPASTKILLERSAKPDKDCVARLRTQTPPYQHLRQSSWRQRIDWVFCQLSDTVRVPVSQSICAAKLSPASYPRRWFHALQLLMALQRCC